MRNTEPHYDEDCYLEERYGEEEMTDEERKCCTNPIILKLANKLNKSGGHYVSVNIKDNKFGICKQCHKFNLIGKKDRICSGCYYQGLEETTCLNWE